MKTRAWSSQRYVNNNSLKRNHSPRHCYPAEIWKPPLQTGVCHPGCETRSESWSGSVCHQSDTWRVNMTFCSMTIHSITKMVDFFWLTNDLCSTLDKTRHSPTVPEEGISRDSVSVGYQCGHTAVHKHTEGHMVKLFDRGFKFHHVTQKVLFARPLKLPVTCEGRAREGFSSRL